MAFTSLELVGTALFALAVLHTFCTRYFERLAHRHHGHAGLWHLLGEVEIVFGFWAILLLLYMAASRGADSVADYMATRHFVEPVFVFAIMVISASRPILELARRVVGGLGRALPVSAGIADFYLALSFVPLLGSFITEPAAMTVAALMLRDGVFSRPVSARFKYATLGVLFVNVSIGGTLTSFAAPPVLMVAGTWGWTDAFMLSHFGWKAALAVVVNATVLALVFRRQLREHAREGVRQSGQPIPAPFILANVALLIGVVISNHRPDIFMGLFLLFLGLAEAYRRYHERLLLREGLLVGSFLAGLVVLGGQQAWWLQTLLARLDETTLFFGAAALTAITDNAALTYLGSLVEGLSDGLRYALVAGAVAGGGLTVIANAPNPAGFAILRGSFEDKAISPFGLIVAALPPTIVALVALRAPGGLMSDKLELQQLTTWVAELDRGILFLFLLPFAVAAFAFLADLLRARRGRSAEAAPNPGRAATRSAARSAATRLGQAVRKAAVPPQRDRSGEGGSAAPLRPLG